MKPYYDDGTVAIYHGDCREILPAVDADVLIADPPYGMAYVSNSSRYGSTSPIAGDDTAAVRDWVLDAWGERPSAVFGTWRVPRPRCDMLLIWDKGDSPGMGDLSMPWGPSHEEIYVRGRGWAGKRRGAVLRHNTLAASDRRRLDHPTPKPVALMADLIRYAPPGVILDPFMGSGSTLRAAKDLGRRVIGRVWRSSRVRFYVGRVRVPRPVFAFVGRAAARWPRAFAGRARSGGA